LSVKLIRSLLTKDQMRDSSPVLWERFRNYNKIARSIGIHLMRLFFKKVSDKMLNSDRILLPTRLGDNIEKEMYITDVQQSHKKYLNSHSDGKVYNAVIIGFNSPISIKFNSSYRQKLKSKLEEGQSFY
jgi:hypothetical protein